MARLQILQLPAGTGDDRPPFVLVVDQCIPQRVILGPDTPFRDYWEELALQIGAQGVIVTPETIDIPAFESCEHLKHAAEPETAEDVRKRVAKERKTALLDALGMDHTRDWDDIRNAAAGIRKERDAQTAAIERVRQEPTEPEIMDAQQEHPTVWMHGYHCGVLAAKNALRPRDEPTAKP